MGIESAPKDTNRARERTFCICRQDVTWTACFETPIRREYRRLIWGLHGLCIEMGRGVTPGSVRFGSQARGLFLLAGGWGAQGLSDPLASPPWGLFWEVRRAWRHVRRLMRALRSRPGRLFESRISDFAHLWTSLPRRWKSATSFAGGKRSGAISSSAQ